MKEEMNFLHVLILDGFSKLKGERSKSGLSNILYGKQNHQTWTDIHYFNLVHLYRFLYKEEPDIFLFAIDKLISEHLLQHSNEEVITLTNKGHVYLRERTTLLNHFANRDGRIIIKMTSFWDQLHLLIQTLSFLLRNEKNFTPIIRDYDTQGKVKGWLKREGIKNGATGLYKELRNLLEQLTEYERELALFRLSGPHRTASTLKQLQWRFNKSYWQIKWDWESLLTKIDRLLKLQSWEYLPQLDQRPHTFLTGSSVETYNLLQEGYTIEEISQIRKLKATTIMDHIVEIALLIPHFSITPFVSHDDFMLIKEEIEQAETMRLRQLKERLPHYSYFQIRLVLTVLNKGR